MSIGKKIFGKTDRSVTMVGLGGEGVLRTYGMLDEAQAVINAAATHGITYFDSANAYAGSEGYYGSFWPKHRQVRDRSFQASKSHDRTAEGAMDMLENTLKTMGIDHLDLWQIHDVRTEEDIEAIEAKGGALEAFLRAKDEGKVKNIGVTGHHDPDILTYCVDNWPMDSVLLPVNPVEGVLGGFLTETIPAARKKGMAIIGMKVLGHSNFIASEAGITADVLIRYALSKDITVAIVGCSTPEEVKTLVSCGTDFKPMTEKEMGELESLYRPYADKIAYYRGVI